MSANPSLGLILNLGDTLKPRTGPHSSSEGWREGDRQSCHGGLRGQIAPHLNASLASLAVWFQAHYSTSLISGLFFFLIVIFLMM